MFPTDPNKGPELTLEWDKNERQRARNRINQRNYRRRKSEQSKKNEKKRATSASESPATSNVNIPDTPREESEVSSQGQASSNSLHYNFLAGPWRMATTTNPGESSSSIPMSSAEVSSDDNVARGWRSAIAAAGDMPEPITKSEDWQTAQALESQLSLAGLTPQLQDVMWLNSPQFSPRQLRSDISTTSSTRGKTTLHLAAENGHSQCVRVLLFHGADPNLQDADGYTALHVAAENGHAEVASILIEGGCDLNAVNGAGKTALHLAAETDHFEIIDQLLRAGGDPNIQITEQQPPL